MSIPNANLCQINDVSYKLDFIKMCFEIHNHRLKYLARSRESNCDFNRRVGDILCGNSFRILTYWKVSQCFKVEKNHFKTWTKQ
jgi:hypothetical protein